ncbi:hypothetical protein [Cytobacillus horneckiae]|uniref:hypothetical protein n=1 Tax=Cytobacillus horneckiae TaxID=549687 RepID=UPI00399F2B8E
MMTTYTFKESLLKRKKIIVVNEQKEEFGEIRGTNLKGFEKGNGFIYHPFTGAPTFLGIKKNGIKRLVQTNYEAKHDEEHYHFSDKLGANFLYFCVLGEIQQRSVCFEENWDKQIECKIGDKHFAKIKPNEWTLQTTIEFLESVDHNTPLFSITILMSFMYKIYNKEAAFLEDLLFE